jgi:hypothetical protein
VQKGSPTNPCDLLPQHQKRRLLEQPQSRGQRLRKRTRHRSQIGNSLLTQANSIISKYKDAADQANKNSEIEAQVKKIQDSIEKEKEKSYQEF